jgi:hypothetical protein
VHMKRRNRRNNNKKLNNDLPEHTSLPEFSILKLYHP